MRNLICGKIQLTPEEQQRHNAIKLFESFDYPITCAKDEDQQEYESIPFNKLFENELKTLHKMTEEKMSKQAIFNCDDRQCSSCDNLVYLYEWGENYAKPNFCQSCGQPLDRKICDDE